MSGLCAIAKNVANVHAGPSSDTELVTQALMGQPAWILEERDDWAHVRTWDTYAGWTLRRWLVRRPDGAAYASGSEVAVVRDLFADLHVHPDLGADILTKVTISVELEVIGQQADFVAVRMPDGRTGYIERAAVYFPQDSQRLPPVPEEIVRTAKRFVGVPYLWGGTSPFGLDCSGFVQLVYRIHGIALLRDAHMLAADERVQPVEESKLSPSDLVFFAGGEDKTKITHVGMYIGDGRFIHSAGSTGVTINRLEDAPYNAIYWGARRI